MCRHGQSDWNAAGRYQGRLDEAVLSPLGRQQAQALAARLASRPLTAIYSSPLKRALQTAQIVAAAQHSSGGVGGDDREMETPARPLLMDVDHGEWSGLGHAEVERRWPELSRVWRATPAEVRFPGGESLMEVRARALGFVAWVRHEHADGQILIVTHGELIQLMLAAFLDMQPNQMWRLPADHCGVSIVEDYDVPLVMGVNDTCQVAQAEAQGLRSAESR
ncbi:MAG: histidine phosphatase family protein [Chloroflexi bacterium]|nr:histidine phosphatase family protein [Chloroflexota bacterium]